MTGIGNHKALVTIATLAMTPQKYSRIAALTCQQTQIKGKHVKLLVVHLQSRVHVLLPHRTRFHKDEVLYSPLHKALLLLLNAPLLHIQQF